VRKFLVKPEKVARVMAHSKQKKMALISVNLRFAISNYCIMKRFVSIAHNVYAFVLLGTSSIGGPRRRLPNVVTKDKILFCC
jgi:hypothetical protein